MSVGPQGSHLAPRDEARVARPCFPCHGFVSRSETATLVGARPRRVPCPRLRGHAGIPAEPAAWPRKRGHAAHDSGFPQQKLFRLSNREC